ncbi:rhodanese-like domain-containing protein [Bacteroidota bacterium]
MIFRKMKLFHLFLICLLVYNFSSFAQTDKNSCYENIDCNDFNLLIEINDVTIIDVRTNIEFRKERIKDAQIASNKESLKAILENLDKSTFILVYCTTGLRSEKASEIICEEYEFINVFNLDGGIKQWKKKAYPIDNLRIPR